MDPSLPPGTRDSNPEDDQHCALPDSDFREAEERDIRLEEKAEQRKIDESVDGPTAAQCDDILGRQHYSK